MHNRSPRQPLRRPSQFGKSLEAAFSSLPSRGGLKKAPRKGTGESSGQDNGSGSVRLRAAESPERCSDGAAPRRAGTPPLVDYGADLPFLPRLLTVSEVAEALQVSPKTVRRLAALQRIRLRSIPGALYGSFRRFPCVAFGEKGGLSEMPKLPRGMFKRRSSFYVRLHEGGKDRWISLGADYEAACRKLREIRLGVVEEKGSPSQRRSTST